MDNSGDVGPQRGRCMTWPLPRPEYDENGTKVEENEQAQREQEGGTRKSSSRRNAWGNFSYAELITKAIQSSPDQRLTLSQIYEWMVTNVPYFKDKGDSNSSAGWKNSIRHNLSLHSRFVRVQNEGTGKSSWWTLNTEAKPGKATRRRAGSIDGVVRSERRRGRLKKSLKPITDSTDEGTDLSTTPTMSSPIVKTQPTIWSRRDADYIYGDRASDSNECESPGRSRTTSNASSCGRPSPIVPGDMENMQTPMSPMYPDYSLHNDFVGRNNGTGNSSELADTFDSMFIQSPYQSETFPSIPENGIHGNANLQQQRHTVYPNQGIGGIRSRDVHNMQTAGYNSNAQQFNMPTKAMIMQQRQAHTQQHQLFDQLQQHRQQAHYQHDAYAHQGTSSHSHSGHSGIGHDADELYGLIAATCSNRDEFGNDGSSMLRYSHHNIDQSNYAYNPTTQADMFATQSYPTTTQDVNEMEQLPMMTNRFRHQNLNQVSMSNYNQPIMHSTVSQQHHQQPQPHHHQGINQFDTMNEKLPHDDDFDMFHPNLEYDSVMTNDLINDGGVLLDNPLLPAPNVSNISNRPVTTSQQ